jgi:membrane dipeptidase
MPKITQALLDRGYKAEDLRKILGGNALRVFREAERVSHEMQSAAAPAVK